MPFEQVNGKVVSVPVAPGREVLARRGAMLAYTGQVQFAPVRDISLKPHDQIALVIGQPSVVPVTYTFPDGL